MGFDSLETVTAEVSIRTFKKDQNGKPIGLVYNKYQLDVVRCQEVRDRIPYLGKNENTKTVYERGICMVPKEGELDKYYVQGQALEDVDANLLISV